MGGNRAGAGYSGSPLPSKLGIGEGARVGLVGAPPGFEDLLQPRAAGVRLLRRVRGSCDMVILFVKARRDLERRVGTLGEAIFPDGSLWVAWPKRASRVATDMTEDAVRDVALPFGLVDNKVAAIDETWSGLRLVWRRERRG